MISSRNSVGFIPRSPFAAFQVWIQGHGVMQGESGTVGCLNSNLNEIQYSAIGMQMQLAARGNMPPVSENIAHFTLSVAR